MREQTRVISVMLATVICPETGIAVISALKYWKRHQQVHCFAVGV